jgi:hypothetical protein
MPASSAHVTTTRASRYLAQLCRHGGKLGRIGASHRPRSHRNGGARPDVLHTEWSDTDGVIDFGWGRCTLRATDDTLTLYAESEDPQQLQRIQEGIARSLARIGRRDRLTVAWSSPEPGSAGSPNRPNPGPASTS